MLSKEGDFLLCDRCCNGVKQQGGPFSASQGSLCLPYQNHFKSRKRILSLCFASSQGDPISVSPGHQHREIRSHEHKNSWRKAPDPLCLIPHQRKLRLSDSKGLSQSDSPSNGGTSAFLAGQPTPLPSPEQCLPIMQGSSLTS